MYTLKVMICIVTLKYGTFLSNFIFHFSLGQVLLQWTELLVSHTPAAILSYWMAP